MDGLYALVVCGIFGILLLAVYIRNMFLLEDLKLNVDYLMKQDHNIHSLLRQVNCSFQRLEDKFYIDMPTHSEGVPSLSVTKRFPLGKLVEMLMENYTITEQDEYVLKGKKECEEPLP